MGSIRSSAKWNDFILRYGGQVALELLALNVITISILLGHNSCSCKFDENKLIRKATSGYLLIFRKMIKYGTKFTNLHCLHFLTVNTYGLFIASIGLSFPIPSSPARRTSPPPSLHPHPNPQSGHTPTSSSPFQYRNTSSCKHT